MSMPLNNPRKNAKATLALFCRVVDNYGDIGICFRLAKQLVTEYQIEVSLWVDDLVSFQRLCPHLSTTAAQQQVAGIRVIHWVEQAADLVTHDVADIVIEFFGCDLPPNYLSAMRQRPPVWINLEGLSAEAWVEGCHTLPSPQSGLSKYFFYPGFTASTGGLLLEATLLAQCAQFHRQPQARLDFLGQLGLSPTECAGTCISLFCYPDAPVSALFNVWKTGNQPITCLIPQGVASAALQHWMNGADSAIHGALTLRIIPFLSQTDYDLLLWSCAINFVRGEDSLVRAHWAQQAFVWHIYPQEQALHHVKLKAFLLRSGLRDHVPAYDKFSLSWNGASDATPDWHQLWQEFSRDQREITTATRNWVLSLPTNGDLASNLWHFCESIAQKSPKLAL